MISNLSIKTLIPAIFMSRFSIIICMLIIGNWFVFIPWKIEEIGLSKKKIRTYSIVVWHWLDLFDASNK